MVEPARIPASQTTQAWRALLRRLAESRPDPQQQVAQFGALLPPTLRAAAVLVGLVEPGDTDEPGILLTLRASHLRQHAGQISFPGGSIEPGDEGPAAAALREACEEVGLEPAAAEVLGYLPDQYVLTGFRITPVVARLPADFTPRLASEEVQASFILPLSVLLDPATERAGRRKVAGFEVAVRDLQYGEHLIWGATAGMLLTLRDMALS
jgi:8-oxo-dGTP pyrophosphatase MutT (NUDIX family)